MRVKIKGKKREIFGKNACHRLRNEGKVPAILYGHETSSVPLIVEKKDIIRILKSESGENTIFSLSWDGENRDVMIKEIQISPNTDEILHVDLIQILEHKTIRVFVPVVPVGEAVGVKSEGGFVELITRELEIECLPKNIPEQIEADISRLHVHQSLKVGDLTPLEGVEILADKETVIALIDVPHKEEVFEEEKEEEVIGEEEEPEVIRKEKEAEEAEEEKEKKEAGEEK
ncbi:MAG: 50S ribosomal protein L25 [Candidatus Aminicenantales bacterium]